MKFGEQMEQWQRKTEKKIKNARRIIIVQLFSSVVMSTPVDTGRARGNWIFSKGEMIKDQLDQFDKSGGLVISLFIDKIDGEDGVVYLVNSLPYIKRLEYDGWSSQAPSGMVRKNIAKIRRFVNTAIREVN